MLKEPIQQLQDGILAAAIFNEVARGSTGKLKTVKAPGCILMPDFNPPAGFNGDEEEHAKLLPLTCTCFVIVSGRKNEAVAITQEILEDECMELAYRLIDTVNRMQIIIDAEPDQPDSNDLIEHNPRSDCWEFTDIDWTDRSATQCIIAVEFTLRIQI